MARKRTTKKRGPLGRVLRWAAKWLFRLAALALIWVVAYRFVNPPITWLILTEWVRLGDIERNWTPIEGISPHLARAVVAAEDSRFCDHVGFDFEQIGKAIEGGGARGASTITQQTAKNVFLWPGRSWTRKGLEAAFAGAIELAWGKRRILEVYLNVAETAARGPSRLRDETGVFWAADAAKGACKPHRGPASIAAEFHPLVRICVACIISRSLRSAARSALSSPKRGSRSR